MRRDVQFLIGDREKPLQSTFYLERNGINGINLMCQDPEGDTWIIAEVTTRGKLKLYGSVSGSTGLEISGPQGYIQLEFEFNNA